MGDVMPGSNFADRLTIDAKGRVSPQGPLILDDGETLVEVYAWVTQSKKNGPGAFCTAEGKLSGVKYPNGQPVWTTEQGEDDKGSFVPGMAIGTGVTIAGTENGDVDRVFWWIESVTLEAEVSGKAEQAV